MEGLLYKFVTQFELSGFLAQISAQVSKWAKKLLHKHKMLAIC